METDKDLNNFLLARFNKDDVLAEKLWKKDPVLKKALELDDNLLIAKNVLANTYYFTGDYDK